MTNETSNETSLFGETSSAYDETTKKVPGVVFNRQKNLWYARVNKSGKRYNIGSFATQAEAITAREAFDPELYEEQQAIAKRDANLTVPKQETPEPAPQATPAKQQPNMCDGIDVSPEGIAAAIGVEGDYDTEAEYLRILCAYLWPK